MLLYLTDGEHNNLVATTDYLIPRSKRFPHSERKRTYAKTAAACSGTQAANDASKTMHPVVHAGYRHPKFRYDRIWSDPEGAQFQVVKSVMKRHLKPADFATLWKAVASGVDIHDKALIPPNLKLAFNSTGAITVEGVIRAQSGLSNDVSDPVRILSKNDHFHSLVGESGPLVVATVPGFSEVFGEHRCIPEGGFLSELAKIEGADNSKPIKEGNMETNDMAINRQRFVILDDTFFAWRDGLVAEKERKKALKELAKNEAKENRSGASNKRSGVDADDAGGPATKKRLPSCGTGACMVPMPDGGVKCSIKGCRAHYCATCIDSPFYNQHQQLCSVVQGAKKKATAPV